MNIRPQAAVSFDDARNTLFGRREQVDPETEWSVESPGADRFSQCSNNGALVLYSPSKMVRIDMGTGKKSWEKEVEESPSLVFPAPEVTVVGYRDGRMEGIGAGGESQWSFKLAHSGHNLSYGAPDLTVLSTETRPGHEPYHLALEPATGEVLWRQAGAVFDNPVRVGEGLMLLKASNSLMCVDAKSGVMKDQQPYQGYGRSLLGNEGGEAWFLDDQQVRRVTVDSEGKIREGWRVDIEPKLCHMLASPDRSVLFVSAENEVLGLDPATGEKLWSQPVQGAHHQWSLHLTDEGHLLLAGGKRLVCLDAEGSRRFDVPHEGTVRVTPRGILSTVDPGYPQNYRLERLDPTSGEVMYWAEIPRGTSPPWLDWAGSVKVTQAERIDLYQLPDPEKLPPPRAQVIAERSDSVLVGGVRVKRRGES